MPGAAGAAAPAETGACAAGVGPRRSGAGSCRAGAGPQRPGAEPAAAAVSSAPERAGAALAAAPPPTVTGSPDRLGARIQRCLINSDWSQGREQDETLCPVLRRPLKATAAATSAHGGAKAPLVPTQPGPQASPNGKGFQARCVCLGTHGESF